MTSIAEALDRSDYTRKARRNLRIVGVGIDRSIAGRDHCSSECGLSLSDGGSAREAAGRGLDYIHSLGRKPLPHIANFLGGAAELTVE